MWRSVRRAMVLASFVMGLVCLGAMPAAARDMAHGMTLAGLSEEACHRAETSTQRDLFPLVDMPPAEAAGAAEERAFVGAANRPAGIHPHGLRLVARRLPSGDKAKMEDGGLPAAIDFLPTILRANPPNL